MFIELPSEDDTADAEAAVRPRQGGGRGQCAGQAEPRVSAGEPRVGGVDRPSAEAAVRELLLAVGEDPDREGLR